MTLSIDATKFSGKVLKAAISKYLEHRKNVKADKKHAQQTQGGVIPRGKQKLKDLIGQNVSVSTVNVSDKDMRGFDRIARKYGVDYAVRKVKGQNRYLVFFKSRDAGAITSALTEYSARKWRQQSRPSLRKVLRRLRAAIQRTTPPVRNQHQEHGSR